MLNLMTSVKKKLGRCMLLLLVFVVSVRGSCDGIFSYTRSDDGTYNGRLRIAPPQFYNGGNFEVKLDMMVNKILPKGRPLFYNVRLPSQNPLPKVRQLQVNGRSICQENPYMYGSVTQIGLQHTIQLHAGSGVPPKGYPSELRQASGDCQTLYSPLRDGVLQLRVPPLSTRSPGDAVTVKIHAATPPNQGNLEESLEVVARRLRAGNTEPIKFIYTMPASTTRLTGVQVNEQYICHEQQVENRNGGVLTWTTHTIFPSGGGQPAPAIPFATTTQSPSSHSSSTPRLPNEGDCGSLNMRNQLIRLGTDVRPGAWPWLAAIYVNYASGASFYCGGTLVTLRHVISAAHCTYNKDDDLIDQDITVILGMHKVDNFSAPAQTMHVKRIIRHPSYEHKLKEDADIVILELANAAQQSYWVRPVCAWGSADTNLVGHTGMVVGWGMDEIGKTLQTSVPRSAQVPVVSRDTCRKTHDEFKTGITENNFCAGNRDGRGPCNGDSGGGLFFLEPGPSGTQRWVLRGVVSFSLKDNSKRCDLSHYVAYTDVTKLAPWLSRYIT
ncbi:hypothetical protein B566_EDAN005163 [Ephemera danica]|nr:hypothetical protein B566_EDAN005163 [Ephemera danica]